MAGEYIEFNNSTQPAINDTNLNRLQQLIKQDIQGAVSGDTLPIGAILPFGSDTVPENWLLCDGSAVSRTNYQELFNTIGTSYGTGDGFTTFNLPDLRGRVGVGKSSDTEFDTLGETGGEKTHTLTIDEMPSHNHSITSNNIAASSSTYVAATSGGSSVPNPVGNITIDNTGGGQPHNIVQPYIVTNYIIKAYQSAGLVATVVDNLNSNSATDALSAKQGKILNERNTYSTTETVIGTWIDGKPIYRKVIETTSTGTQTHGISNFDTIIDVSGMAYFSENSPGYGWQPIPRNVPANNETYGIGIGNIRSSEFTLVIGTSYTGFSKATIIFEYTKTTD